LDHFTKSKGLNVHAYVIMTSHLHLILSSKEGFDLVATIRDFKKKFTSKKLINLIQERPESRREWMLNKFNHEAQRTKRGIKYILWKESCHGKQIGANKFLVYHPQ